MESPKRFPDHLLVLVRGRPVVNQLESVMCNCLPVIILTPEITLEIGFGHNISEEAAEKTSHS